MPADLQPTSAPSDPNETFGFVVTSESFFLPEESKPADDHYLFGYRMTIQNNGDDAAQLMARHWIIIDADGRREEVQGPGVIGETPTIQPGDSHTYTSYCPIHRAWGTMEGSYDLVRADGTVFSVPIPRFFLVSNA